MEGRGVKKVRKVCSMKRLVGVGDGEEQNESESSSESSSETITMKCCPTLT